MSRIAIAVHGGAKPFSSSIEEHQHHYAQGMQEAIEGAYEILKKGGSSLDAVEAAVKTLEDNPYFNAGRGSALNQKGQVEMDASIMNGANLQAGAVAMVRKVKNPISLARAIMEKTSHVFIGGEGALSYAARSGLELQSELFFITDEQRESFWKERAKDIDAEHINVTGTVGAVAVDRLGNIASATSTGGTTYQMEGRIGDSCMIGAGCYANNKTCAVSATGDGEYIIRGVIAHEISSAMEYKGLKVQEACDYVLYERNKDCKGDIGVIAVDRLGNIGIAFNSECMLRAWQAGDEALHIGIRSNAPSHHSD
jgi:beta-aspartyl-peptidase (threonine type)